MSVEVAARLELTEDEADTLKDALERQVDFLEDVAETGRASRAMRWEAGRLRAILARLNMLTLDKNGGEG